MSTERKEQQRLATQRYREKNPDKVQTYYAENSERLKAARRARHAANKPLSRKQSMTWRHNNPEAYNTYQREWQQRRRVTPEGKMLVAIRNATARILAKGGCKPGSSIRLLGCTLMQAKTHIEQQFLEGMSWSNTGMWHIDHIKPLACFDLTDSKQVYLAAHYTNLQPLWAIDNLKKGASYVG